MTAGLTPTEAATAAGSPFRELASEASLAFSREGEPPEGGPSTPALAFALARRRYLNGERIQMGALASELGISRPTLYRWTGDREQLMGDVLFSFSDASFAWARAQTAHLRGSERLIGAFRAHVGALVNARPLQIFLQQETQTALRILTSRDSSVQIRTVARLADFYRQEQQSGGFHPPADIDTLAFAVVKVTEAFIYNDAIVAVEPEVDRAAAIVALMLGAPAAVG